MYFLELLQVELYWTGITPSQKMTLFDSKGEALTLLRKQEEVFCGSDALLIALITASEHSTETQKHMQENRRQPLNIIVVINYRFGIHADSGICISWMRRIGLIIFEKNTPILM